MDSNYNEQKVKIEIGKLEDKIVKVLADLYRLLIFEKEDNKIAKLKEKELLKKYQTLANKQKDLFLLKYKNCYHAFAKVGENDYCCLKCGLYTKNRDYDKTDRIYNTKSAAMAEYFKFYSIANDKFLNISFKNEGELNYFRLTHIYYPELDQTKKTKHR